MGISLDDLRRISTLASLPLPPARATALLAELNALIAHLEPLIEIDTTGVEGVEGVGAAGMPLAQDYGPPVPLARTPDAFAPRFRDGFFLVPRVASHEGEGPG